MIREFYLHLVSDSTGETLSTAAKAACAQFEAAKPLEHLYSLIRSERQLHHAIEGIAARPGVVFFTLVNPGLRKTLEDGCAKIGVPCVSILDRAVQVLGTYLGAEESHKPGGQHEMDSRYLDRVEAVNFTLQHDDGQSTRDIGDADVILVGASRTSKTPTCVYLAIRGVRAANVPVVPGAELPDELFIATKPLDRRVVGDAGSVASGATAAPEHDRRDTWHRIYRRGIRACRSGVHAEIVRAPGLADDRRLAALD
jgi:regulator of PEP synthase PpsR (kinase-PPPase family)